MSAPLWRAVDVGINYVLPGISYTKSGFVMTYIAAVNADTRYPFAR